MRHQVFLRNDPPAVLADPPVDAPPKKQAFAGGLKPPGGLSTFSRGPISRLSSLPIDDLRLRFALKRRHSAQSPRHRQLPNDGPGSGQRLQRTGRSLAGTDLVPPAGVLANPPFQAMAVSGSGQP